MRVPWRDRPWDQFICDDPLGNSSCTLLAAVGKGRDDLFEAASAGAAIDSLDQNRRFLVHSLAESPMRS